MYANARYRNLRTKRRLPAKSHYKPAQFDLCKNRSAPADPNLCIPQVTADHNLSPKSLQLTLFYQLLPQLCRIRFKT